MTPTQIEDAARRKYNSSSSSFFSSAEVWDLIYQAELEIATETRMLEGKDTSITTVVGTQSYAYPTGVLEIKRVEYDGRRLEKIEFREDDAMTFGNANITSTGAPYYYYDWANRVYLRSIPNDTKTLALYYYKEPARVTSGSQTLEIPALFHMCIADRVAGEMASKDAQPDIAAQFFDAWYNKHMPAMLKWTRKRRTGDKFSVVKDIDAYGSSSLGSV